VVDRSGESHCCRSCFVISANMCASIIYPDFIIERQNTIHL